MKEHLVINKKMLNFVPIKKSLIEIYDNVPLYYIPRNGGDPLLYKNADQRLDNEKLFKNQHPMLYINKDDEASVTKKLQAVLNNEFRRSIFSKGIKTIKDILSQIVDEALSGPIEYSLSSMPETIEILFLGARKNPDLVDALASIKSNCPLIVEHSINVLALTMQYCFFKKLHSTEIKKLGLCALLHDIGTTQIDKRIIETNKKLTDEEFLTYKTHTTTGYYLIDLYPTFDMSVSRTILEHHERLDGSGYPDGKKKISFEAQIIGLFDSYEPLRFRDKTYRKALKPYDALQIIKKDVVKGKYNKKVFIDLCECLMP